MCAPTDIARRPRAELYDTSLDVTAGVAHAFIAEPD
jgi:hypothetical protein